MSNTPSTLMVSVTDSVAVVKICGRASFTASADFKRLIQELSQRGYSRFVLDLSNCLVMDSTFLGVLASAGMKMTRQQKGGESARLELFQPSPRVLDLLDNLGVARLFHIIHRAEALPEKLQSVETLPCAATPEELSKTCLEAHLALMELDPANIPRFKDVTKFLQDDLEKLKHRKG